MTQQVVYLRVPQAAARVSVSTQKMREFIKNGLLPATNISLGKRPTYLIRDVDLDAVFTPVGCTPVSRQRRTPARIDAGVERRFG